MTSRWHLPLSITGLVICLLSALCIIALAALGSNDSAFTSWSLFFSMLGVMYGAIVAIDFHDRDTGTL